MEQERFGAFIKEIRKKNNLTQKQLAEKYNVTYQAVSKWENGLNMPDMALIKQISIDFGISLDDLLKGEYKKKKRVPIYFYALFVFFLLFLFLGIYLFKSRDFQFKTLSATCDNFTISGTIAYNNSKSAVSITNIEYCGKSDTEKYKKIECNLYEASEATEKKIGSYVYEKESEITLEEFLRNATLAVSSYETICKEYKEDSLYLLIHATNKEDRVTTYRIPLQMEACS